MPQPQCEYCKRAVGFALHVACASATQGNCAELVAEFRQACENISSMLGGHVPADVCDRGARIIATLCDRIGFGAVGSHIDEIASMVCHSVGACP